MEKKYLEDSLFTKISQLIYWALLSNIGFTLINLPFFFALTLLPFSFKHIFLYVITSLTVLPSVYVIFDHFEKYYETKTLFTVKEYFISWKKSLKNILPLAIVPTILFFALYISIHFTIKNNYFKIFPLIYSFLAIIALGVLLTFIYFRMKNPSQPFNLVFKTAFYLSIRKFYLTVLNIFLIAILFLALVMKPIIGFLILPSIIGVIIFKNSSLLLPNSTVK